MKQTLIEFFNALHKNIPSLSFAVRFWDDDIFRGGDGAPSFVVTFKTSRSAGRIFSKGSLGFGEEYMAGNILVDGNLQELLRLGMDPQFQNMKISAGTKLAILLNHFKSLNTPKGALRNISTHYDKGNDFYRLYLDDSMTYSCAYFRDSCDTLEQAQQQKYEHICRKLNLAEGESLLDVGCGWGGMLMYAAQNYGVTGVGCTLSAEQASYAREKIREQGLQDRIDVLLEDYRNMSGRFDKFVSIGMFEHVGRTFIPKFMNKIRTLLKPGAAGLLHTIGKDRDTPRDGWIMKYIFPGGYIPVIDHIVRVMGRSDLVPLDIENLRLHYAATLDEWARRFETHVQDIEKMFGDIFVRTWRLYLNGSAAAFRHGELRLYQILFTNGLNNSFPSTLEHLYR
ncbi:MAG TPA: cyclopropane-fatty-acyl-phospholipid synthase family protein [Syntrophorhabdaceae bacterium]|nr:cyclopropane-fatty-acyl-phospholipid synthase family protein [Syntrophorhabdaceae bacterium]